MSAQAAGVPLQERADRFLEVVNATYKPWSTYRARLSGRLHRRQAGHDAGAEVAGKAMAAFAGNPA